jgi:hypothetical protein
MGGLELFANARHFTKKSSDSISEIERNGGGIVIYLF